MTDVHGSAGPFRFGLFEVNPRTGELLKQGRPLRLRGRPFDILVVLLQRGGDLVSREELRQRLWAADTFVDFDHGLNAAVNRLRETLGDSAENPRFIETQPKRGYRFIAPITTAAVAPAAAVAVIAPALPRTANDDAPLPPLPEPSTPSSSTIPADARGAGVLHVSVPSRFVLIAAIAALVIAIGAAVIYLRVPKPGPSSKMTLAVLPFENLSGDADQEFFSDGITEEMIAELGKLDPAHLGVIARTTTRLYKAAHKSVGQIRQELGVDYVLEGSVRRAGERVRITAQLVETKDMTHLWSESYDRDVSDVLAIQTEVSMRVARALELALSHPPSESTGAAFPAYEMVLRGRKFREQATEESTRKAIEYFQRAIAIDGSYAPAHAGLADAYFLLGAPGWEVEEPSVLLQRAKTSAERALAIDSGLSTAHAVLGMIRLNFDWDKAGAEREIQEAIRLNPSAAQAHQYYSAVLTTQGRFDEAIREAARAVELDPMSAPSNTTLAIRYWYAGRIDDAFAQFTKSVDTTPEFSVAHWGIAQCVRRRGDHVREIDELRRAAALAGGSAYMRAHLAYGLALSGDRAKATTLRQELESEAHERYASPYHFALIAAGLDDRPSAIAWLEKAFADRSGWMAFLPVEPEFESLRQTPEFQRLLARVKPRT